MALTQRQQLFYTFRVSLYKPTPISFQSGGAMLDQMADTTYQPTPAYTNVPCYFKSASEIDVPAVQGLQSEANMFTYFVFDFDAAQQVDNTWAIQLTMPGHPNNGDWYYATDVPKSTTSAGNRKVNRNQVYAKRGDKPNGVA